MLLKKKLTGKANSKCKVVRIWFAIFNLLIPEALLEKVIFEKGSERELLEANAEIQKWGSLLVIFEICLSH